MSDIHAEVQNYYGHELQSSEDLKTNACCTISSPPRHIKEALSIVHEEVVNKYYGCGLTIPDELTGLTILDLGSGSGRDCYIAAKLVGEKGKVVGVDMTDEQIELANKHQEYHRKKFNYPVKNTAFLKGNIEKLDQLSLENESFDLIISNCVVNLAENKAKVLQDAYRLLKKGGEMYFSDIYCDRRVPNHLQKDAVLWGECLSGALYWNDFLKLAKNAGFTDPRAVSTSPITIENEELEEKVGELNFYSVTFRLFKIEGLESDCEDYGQAICYKGSVKTSPCTFQLDDHHFFEKGKIERVCGNTYKMLHDSRYKKHFDFFGDWSTHYGIFEGCGANNPFPNNNNLNQFDEGCC